MRILLLTPPMTQPNTSYPATAYLKGFLDGYADELDLELAQVDASLELFLRIFSVDGLARVLGEIEAMVAEHGERDMPASVAQLWTHGQRYLDTIDEVIAFLQGADPTLALRICSRRFLPEGARFRALDESRAGDPLAWAFGSLGTTDRAKHLASLYLDDIGDAIRDGLDERFELARYAHSLAASAASFEPMREALRSEGSVIDELLEELSAELLAAYEPDLVALSVPFPGNMYGALRMASVVRRERPDTVIAMGGGYVNTELRELEDPSLFDFIDYLTLDDGEEPLLRLVRRLAGRAPDGEALLRTLRREEGALVWESDEGASELGANETCSPSYQGLPLDRYVSLLEMLNPMHRLWSDGRWNKLTVAHGCYWKKCSFCDIELDYIKRYDPVGTTLLVDRIETVIEETGQTGFHLVDEAAPPARLRAMSEELIERGLGITWWGNIRFEKSFSPELIETLAESGCVAISGGLEVADPRLLTLMRKGVSVEQVARVTRAFSDAGVLVHAYLMYGFPSQTQEETVDALERVRQLFAAGCIQSAFWHRFVATVHSPVGHEPELFQIRLAAQPASTFARNDLAFEDPTGVDHDALGKALRAAVYNYMHGLGLDVPVERWFSEHAGIEVAPTRVDADFVQKALAS